MGQIENTILAYERLMRRKYKITIENGVTFVLIFEKQHYHHLAGYHYLTDIMTVANPSIGKSRFYRQIKNGVFTEEQIIKSQLYGHIEERIRFFSYIEEIVSASNCKIIVDYDKNRAGSEINAKYFLYKREGNPLAGEPVTYYLLFIGYDGRKSSYFPATYIVEHSNKYVSGQNMLECKIEVFDDEKEKLMV